MLQSEKNSVALMKDLVQKFSKSAHLVLDALVATLFTEKAYVSWEMPGGFVGFEKNISCVETSIVGLVENRVYRLVHKTFL